jgi:hypothetical protein
MPRSFTGPTVTAAEAAASTVLGSVFEYLIPGLENQPGILKTLFIRDIGIRVEPSPTHIGSLPNDGTIVAVGSPGYNSVSEWIQDALNPLIRFDDNNSSLLLQGQQSVTDASQGTWSKCFGMRIIQGACSTWREFQKPAQRRHCCILVASGTSFARISVSVTPTLVWFASNEGSRCCCQPFTQINDKASLLTPLHR